MPTTVDIKNLKINKLTEAQYDTAVQGGVIGENELSVLTDAELEQIQVSTLPTASADELGKIYQYVGATSASYTNGYFYKCISDGQTPATYSWENIEVQAGGGGSGLNVGDIFLTMRNDNELNGAVECDGSTYNTTDFTGAQSIGNLLADGKVPYVSMAVYASTVASQGWCDKFGWDGTGNTQFKVPTLSAYIWQKLQTSVVGNGTPMRIVDLTQGGTSNFAYKTGNLFGFSDTPTSPGVGSEHPAGVVNDPTNSGLVAGSASDISQQRCMVQLATSATDEALETCTSVLADVATLKGYDYVVDFQAPTAQNNYTWYRKYKSGWVEQGGYKIHSSNESNGSVTFPVEMSDTNYVVSLTKSVNSNFDGSVYAPHTRVLSTTGFTYAVNVDVANSRLFWTVSGMASS